MSKAQLAERLREVFRTEALEDLAVLDSAFAEWASAAAPPGKPEEAVYRTAHKIKGACRAVGFAEGQTLGFLLEYLFRTLHENPLPVEGELACDAADLHAAFVTAVRAFVAGEAVTIPPGLVERLNARLAACGSTQRAELPAAEPPSPVPRASVNPRLLASFRAEAVELLEALRAALDGAGCGAIDAAAADRALRAAHTLKGAARVVKMNEVSELTHSLEDTLRALGASPTDPGLLDAARQTLREIERAASELDSPSAAGAKSAPSSAPSAPSSAATKPPVDGEFFRVERSRLKTIEDTFSELLVALPQVGALADEAGSLAAEFETLAREEESLRHGLGALLYRAPENREFARAASYVNFVSRQIRGLQRLAARLSARARRAGDAVGRRVETLDDNLHALQVTPAGDVLDGLADMAAEIGGELAKPIQFDSSGFDIEMDRPTLQRLRVALVHLIRNSIDHGIETAAERASSGKPPRGLIRVALAFQSGRYAVEISDDGRGLPTREIRRIAAQSGLINESEAARMPDDQIHRLIFHPHLSTANQVTRLSGRGMGLSSVEEAVAALNGSLEVETAAGKGTTFRLFLPAGRSGSSALLVEASGRTFGLPARFVEKVAQVAASDILTVSGRPHWSSPDGPVPVYGLAELLGLAGGIPPEGRTHAVVVNRESGRELLTVDRLVGLRQVVLRELPPAAAAAGLYSGCIPLEDGTSGLLLDMPAVLARAAAAPGLRARIEAGPIAAPQIHLPAILVVDDSYTSRTLEAGVIESMGYRVFQAADGLDGLRVLRNEAVDIILCDVEMPRMDGFGMLAAVKSNDRLRDIPFILISSIEDPSIVEKGLALGADSYIVKRHFEQDALRDIIAHYL